MRIKILDKTVCENCTRNECSRVDVIQKTDFFNLKTEQFVCPVRLLKQKIIDDQLKAGYIDVPPNKNNEHPEECVYCGLCAIYCYQQNLEIIDYEYSYIKDTEQLPSESVGNTIAMSYLNCLFDFSANTNIIKPLHFDGYVYSSDATECFVEVDIKNDSLESCRRLLADIVTYNHDNSKKVYNGLMVLSNFPAAGSRDVFAQIESIKKFPQTSNLRIFVTTFSLLRYFVINHTEKNLPFDEIFYCMTNENKDEYIKRLIANGIVTKDIRDLMFK